MPAFVKVTYNNENIIEHIQIEGHAGVKRSGEGYEVCIALSAISQAMYRAILSSIGRKYIKYSISNGNLSLYIKNIYKLDDVKKNEYKIISNGYLVGIKSLINEYPDYIKYIEE